MIVTFLSNIYTVKATEGLYKILALAGIWWIHLTISIDFKICSVRAVVREMF